MSRGGETSPGEEEEPRLTGSSVGNRDTDHLETIPDEEEEPMSTGSVGGGTDDNGEAGVVSVEGGRRGVVWPSMLMSEDGESGGSTT